MPEDTPDFDIPKPLDSDKPPSLESSVGPAFDRIDDLFGAIDLSQLVVPGLSDGKLVIVKDGAAAYKAMSGDATIDEDGVLQLGAGVVGTNELAAKAVTGAKVDDTTLGDSKLTSPIGGVYRTLGAAVMPLSDAIGTGIYLMNPGGGPYKSGAAITGQAIPLIGLKASDYSVNAKTAKLRVTAQLINNNSTPVIPTTDIVFGLYPVSSVGGGADTLTVTLGSVVSGSTVTFHGTSKEALGASGDFAFPEEEGVYILGLDINSIPTDKAMLASAQLQLHHV